MSDRISNVCMCAVCVYRTITAGPASAANPCEQRAGKPLKVLLPYTTIYSITYAKLVRKYSVRSYYDMQVTVRPCYPFLTLTLTYCTVLDRFIWQSARRVPSRLASPTIARPAPSAAEPRAAPPAAVVCTLATANARK